MKKATFVLGVLLALGLTASADTVYTWVPDSNSGNHASTGTIDLNGTTIDSYTFSWPSQGISDSSLTGVGSVGIVGGDLVFSATSNSSTGTWIEDGSSSNEKFNGPGPGNVLNGHWAPQGDPPNGDPGPGNNVPEGGSTLALLGLGLASVRWMRRHFAA
jgi:hypothetical protein